MARRCVNYVKPKQSNARQHSNRVGMTSDNPISCNCDVRNVAGSAIGSADHAISCLITLNVYAVVFLFSNYIRELYFTVTEEMTFPSPSLKMR